MNIICSVEVQGEELLTVAYCIVRLQGTDRQAQMDGQAVFDHIKYKPYDTLCLGLL